MPSPTPLPPINFDPPPPKRSFRALALLLLVVFLVGIAAAIYFPFFYHRAPQQLTFPISPDSPHARFNRTHGAPAPAARPVIPEVNGQYELRSPARGRPTFTMLIPPDAAHAADLHFDLNVYALLQTDEEKSWLDLYHRVLEKPDVVEAIKATPQQVEALKSLKSPDAAVQPNRRDELINDFIAWRSALLAEKTAHPTTRPNPLSSATDAAALKLINGFNSLAADTTFSARNQIGAMVAKIKTILTADQRKAYKDYLVEKLRAAASKPATAPATTQAAPATGP